MGSGNWGSAIAKIIGRNVLARDEFDNEVKMWVYQEEVDGKNLTDIINTEHENVKYLPVRARAPTVVGRIPACSVRVPVMPVAARLSLRYRASSSPRTWSLTLTSRVRARTRRCSSSCCLTSSSAASARR